MEVRRVFLIVLDSFGIGELPDAGRFHDEGSNTLGSVARSKEFHVPNLEKLGLFAIEGPNCRGGGEQALAAYGRAAERSLGKDTTTGHWEIAGLVSEKPMPTYPEGFPEEVLAPFREATGRGVLCNLPYSGTEVIRDYGREQERTGDLIVYTSADSVFQIAAHEEVIPVEQLYEYCRAARRILTGRHGVGRVIARPYTGTWPDYVRTPRRHDFSLEPPGNTILDCLAAEGFDTIGVGKIYDIFAGKGIQRTVSIACNREGMERTLEFQKEDFHGLCFVNLVDFDMVYGHRNDVDGYARALAEFDAQLGEFLAGMGREDVLLITADHGCDPGTPSTDHSREYVPMLLYGEAVRGGVDLGTRESFADMGATVLELLGCQARPRAGESFAESVRK